MSDSTIKIAYFREYPSMNCDIRFVLDVEKKKGGAISKEVIGFAQSGDTLELLKKNIQEKIWDLNKNVSEEHELIRLPNSPNEIDVEFLTLGKPCEEKFTLEDFNQLTSEKIYIRVLKQEFFVCRNAPLIRQLALPYCICANFPVKPAKYVGQECDRKDTEFIWFKSLDKEKWDEVGKGFHYNVQESDIDYYLKVRCVPYSAQMVKGPVVEAVSEGKVQFMAKFPERFPFEERHILTSEKLKGKCFRIVSYNILADKYVNADKFSHCKPDILSIHYRKQVIVKELAGKYSVSKIRRASMGILERIRDTKSVKGYHADILCLQEVDNFYFKDYYQKELKKMGYRSFYHKKGNCLPEGLVCAFDDRRFQKLDAKLFVLKNANEKSKQYNKVFEILNINQDLKEKFMQQQTSLQTIILQDKKSNNIVIIGNIHMYFHPEADEIRLLQGLMAITRLSILKKSILGKYKAKVSIILCGDFNSDFTKSLYIFITKGKVNSPHEDCLKISPFKKIVISHSLSLACASGTPKYTNYTKDYKGCLDYIFIETLFLIVEKRIPVPSEQELNKYEGLPNEYYPSDHVSLIVDLKFKS